MLLYHWGTKLGPEHLASDHHDLLSLGFVSVLVLLSLWDSGPHLSLLLILTRRYGTTKCLSTFRKRLMALCWVKVNMATSGLIQAGGVSKVMKRTLYSYLRCYCNFPQDNWDKLLWAAEVAYKSAGTEDLGISPSVRGLGWNQKSPLELISGTRGEEVNASAEEFRRKLKVSLEDAYFSHKLAKAKRRAENGKYSEVSSYLVRHEAWK